MNSERYIRQTQLPQVGKAGQQKLKNAKVLVVGAGGLGCAVLPYLVTSGVGTIGIIDGDRIALSNLHRQVLYTEATVGSYKATTAKAYLESLNTDACIKAYQMYLTAANALHIISEYDIVVDATDTVKIRYLINDACVLTDTPFIYGAVYKFEGQVSVFNYNGGPTYRCLFPEINHTVNNCETSGVLATTVGYIGMLQANEVMKIILHIGNVLSGKLLIYNTLTNEQQKIAFKKEEAITITKAQFKEEHHTVTVANTCIHTALSQHLILIDVRETHETPKLNLPNTIQIPLSRFKENVHHLNKNEAYAVFCAQGKRSLKAVQILQRHQFQKVLNIEGGVLQIQKQLNNGNAIY